MTGNEKINGNLDNWLKSAVYQENIDFWQRAWGMVKVPYKQLPDLPYLTTILQGLKACGAQRVLDLGCGSGWLSIFLARQGFFVTGVDVAAHALELARTWAEQEGHDLVFDTADIASLPYPPGSFDAVVANSIFEHLTRQLADITVARLKEILIPGGTFFGCFDQVGTGPGQYYSLADGTHVYTDKGRQGMLLHNFTDLELHELFSNWSITECKTLPSGSRIIWAHS